MLAAWASLALCDSKVAGATVNKETDEINEALGKASFELASVQVFEAYNWKDLPFNGTVEVDKYDAAHFIFLG